MLHDISSWIPQLFVGEKSLSNWWFHAEKYEFVSWEYDSQYIGPHHQLAIKSHKTMVG